MVPFFGPPCRSRVSNKSQVSSTSQGSKSNVLIEARGFNKQFYDIPQYGFCQSVSSVPVLN